MTAIFMKKLLKRLKAAFSRGRRPRGDKNLKKEDRGEGARGADNQLWVLFLFPSVCLQDNSHRLPI